MDPKLIAKLNEAIALIPGKPATGSITVSFDQAGTTYDVTTQDDKGNHDRAGKRVIGPRG